ncbi:NAD(P)-dependent dehydrogenase (short-subunit alcohol dehydrogenase family) [Saccharothrix tamanrassetensis]|uniref:NAD(P)-dependent dehydrogenase (Short-subunit alcohol dehydrogenase family) n=1 Tax=Saccharothrix tamanrassetensis TaxID=1051531 RepID=A0A841CKE1_9PSEU|nr:SDR family oxidoreductase [Saccharothrix tamanrassetensis]MBB5956834.1 NAD(P)-dependent dehydrogenase (short-subunit alcohol dehydrogenase family) [Saccharothrix tamanrassetensis]
MRLADKAALVTGASKGIGRAIAERLAADGAQVAVHYGRDERAARETVRRIEENAGRAFAVQADLSTMDGIGALFTGLRTGLSGRPLDIVVNNAAAAPAGPIETDTPEQFDHLVAVNVKAPYFIIQRALPLLSDGGRVITISSVATRMANPTQTSFALTKGAVETMSRTLARALGGRGITVNTVAPGATRTDANEAIFTPETAALAAGLTALNRVGRADDVADVVAFLASHDARWITGQTLDASGGLHLGPRELTGPAPAPDRPGSTVTPADAARTPTGGRRADDHAARP